MSEIVTKEQIEKLLNTDSIKERNELVDKLEQRVDYLVREVFFKVAKTNGWWDWEYHSGEGSVGFRIDSLRIKENYLDIYVEANKYNNIEYMYDNELWGLTDSGMPLDLLWDENVLQTMKESIKKAKEKDKADKAKAKERREFLKEKKKEFQKSAKSKLTPEELWATGLSKVFPKSLKA
jgi:hypothetical protein